jgi:hypothetical protein
MASLNEEELESYRQDYHEHEKDGAEKVEKHPVTKSATDDKARPVTNNATDYETIRLLRQIEKNTSATHFWTRVTGIPVLIGMIIGFLMAMEKCS